MSIRHFRRAAKQARGLSRKPGRRRVEISCMMQSESSGLLLSRFTRVFARLIYYNTCIAGFQPVFCFYRNVALKTEEKSDAENKDLHRSGGCRRNPFKDNALDYESLGRIIDWQIENKTDAIVIAGTTGEGSTLTDEEHRE